MPDQTDPDVQSIYDELNKRGVFTSDSDAQAIGHELRARGVVSDATQGGLIKPAPSQASISKPFSPTSGNTLPPPSQAQLQKQFASSKASNAPITTQTLPMQGKPSGKATPMASPEATAAFQKQYQDQLAGNAFYTKSQLDALPNDFLGTLKRTLSGMVTPENMLIGGAMAAAPALGPVGVAAERAAGVYFGAQGVAQGIQTGQKYGVGAGLGAALPFILPAALGKAGEMVRGKGLPAPEGQSAPAAVPQTRPIVPAEQGTSRPPFVGTPTAETAPPVPEFQPTHTIDDVPVVKVAGTKKNTYVDEQSKLVIPTKAKPAIPMPAQSIPVPPPIEPVLNEAAATAKAPDTTAPPQAPPASPQQTDGSPAARPTGEPLPPESAAAIERIKAGLAAKQTPAPATPSLPSVGDTIDAEVGFHGGRRGGVVTRLQKDPTTGDMVPIIKTASGGEEPLAEWHVSGRVVTPATVETSPQTPASTPASGLGDLGKMASGISDNMHAALWEKIQSGDTIEAGKPSGMLQAAAKIRSAGGLQTPEDAKSFATAWGTEVSGKTGDEFQQSARSVASRFVPAVETPTVAKTAPVTGEPTNVQPETVGRDNEVTQRGTADTVAHGETATAAGKPAEMGAETDRGTQSAAKTSEATKAETPEAKSTGIAQRVHDTRTPGEILPGQGASPEQMINRGRELIKNGVDPEAHMQMMESRGKAFSGDDIAILRAEHERLSKLTDRASDASHAAPLDMKLRNAYQDAKQAETDWAKRIKPFSTEAHKIFVAHQGETDTDTGSFTSIQRAFEDRAGRSMTKAEESQAATHADKVKGLETNVSDLQAKLDAAMKQAAEVKTAPKMRTETNKSNKISLPSDPAELRKALAEMRAKGGLFNSGKGIIEVKPGAKTGAVNFGSKPEFIPEVARAIWSHAKENYIDKGVDFDTTVNGVAADLGLSHEEVKTVFAQNKTIRDVTDDMYRAMSARRSAVNQAKMWIDSSNKSPAAKTWQTVTNLPRGIAVFGHGSVGMVTHAGPNMFRPSAWSTYWPGVINQFKYWDPLHPINGGITHEQAMLRLEKDPNFTTWERNGLKINPNKIYDNYQVYGKYIGAAGRAGNRGFDALKTFRLEYAKKLWEGLPESDKQLPGMQALVAEWVNHASGVGSLDHGKMASIANEVLFAGSLEASRWARVLGDPAKTITTGVKSIASKAGVAQAPSPAEVAIAKFRIRQAVGLAAVYAGALGANNGLLVSTNQKDRINFLHPTQSDWLRFKWNGKTFDPTGNLNGPIRFLAQLLAEANPNRTPAVWEHGEKRSELMTQTTGQYIRGKLAPQYGIMADVATGADAIQRPLPWSKEKGKPSTPKYTLSEYGLKHAPLPMAGAAEAVYEAFREKGATDKEANTWVNNLTTFGKNMAVEMTGVRLGKPSKPFIPASRGSGVDYKPIKF